MQSQPPQSGPPRDRPSGDDVPPHVLATSRAALDLHDPTLVPIPLTADSLLDDVELPPGADRRLVFERDDLWVDVSLWATPEGTRLQVLVGHGADPAGPGPAVVPEFAEVVQPDARTKLPLSGGRAEATGVPPGLTSLTLTTPADPATGTRRAGMRTAWFTV